MYLYMCHWQWNETINIWQWHDSTRSGKAQSTNTVTNGATSSLSQSWTFVDVTLDCSWCSQNWPGAGASIIDGELFHGCFCVYFYCTNSTHLTAFRLFWEYISSQPTDSVLSELWFSGNFLCRSGNLTREEEVVECNFRWEQYGFP